MATQLKEPEEIVDPVEPANDEPQDRDYEAEARRTGWKPEAEFVDGERRPPKFKDAKTFVEDSETKAGLQSKTIDHLKNEVGFLNRQIKRLMKSEQSAYQNALDDIRGKMRDAVATGDEAAFDVLEKRADNLRKEMAEDLPKAGHGEDPQAQFDTFCEDNAWYDAGALASATPEEKSARIKADQLFKKYVREGLTQTLPPSELFAKVASEVAAHVPNMGKAAPRQKPPSDVAGVSRPGTPRNAQTGANLPPEAKEHAERYMRAGIFKVATKAEAYDLMAKDFDWAGWAKEQAR